MLFTPLQIAGMTLAHRVTVAPMCQYSAVDGCMTDWHLAHLGTLAVSGAAMLVIEATGVTPEGRITPQCVGLYSDANEAAMARVVKYVRGVSDIRLGVQLGHAGRKASAERPWEGRGALLPEAGGWVTEAPSALALAPGWPTPRAMTADDLHRVKQAFAAAARRAVRLGLDFIELHCTHGYLLSEFLSPLANWRDDDYGGSLDARMRYPLEVFDAVKAAVPARYPIGAKISGTDFASGGWMPDDAVAFARALKERGCAYVTVSGGGVVLDAKVPVGPGYQVPYAERVKRETGIVTGAVGLITEPQQAEAIVAEGRADFVSLARGMLYDPRWPAHAAHALGATVKYPPQYERAAPGVWPGASKR